MMHLSIDLETFSNINIVKSGLYKYVQSPNFQIILFGYSFDFNADNVKVIDLMQGEQIPAELIKALRDPGTIKHAYNAPFEWYCLNKFFNSPISQWRDTMLHGLYCGYTAGLATTGKVLGLPEDKRKMSVGKALIRTFCVPCKPSKSNGNRTRTLPHHEPEKWNLFKEYNRQDVVTEMEIEKRLSAFHVPEQEQKLWELDQMINAHGVKVDQKLINGALSINETITNSLMNEAVSISGLNNPKSVQQLSKWLEKEMGNEISDLTKDTVKDLIKTTDNDKAKRMLEIRQELSKTSVKKYTAMKTAACQDDRVRGLLQFYGANRTGRWAGRLVQVQNLPRSYIETLDHARDCVKAKRIDALKFVYGSIPDTLSQLIRTAFIPSEGNIFVDADFSAIEARVISWLAGEAWRLDVFKSHGKIYEASASQMFGVPIEKIKKGNPEYALRQKGKVAELALGYGGSSGALINMGAIAMGLKEEELPEIVHRWRSTNRRIVDLWYSIENAALQVLRTGQPAGIKGLLIAHEGDYNTQQDFLTIRLPSGRKLFYAKPFISQNDWGSDALFYHGMNQTTKKWETISTYGGKLTENVIQAIARDCLAENIKKLSILGYQVVFHIHDEIILDVPEKYADLDKVCEIMGQPISWAPGLPLKADGFTARYFKKE